MFLAWYLSIHLNFYSSLIQPDLPPRLPCHDSAFVIWPKYCCACEGFIISEKASKVDRFPRNIEQKSGLGSCVFPSTFSKKNFKSAGLKVSFSFSFWMLGNDGLVRRSQLANKLLLQVLLPEILPEIPFHMQKVKPRLKIEIGSARIKKKKCNLEIGISRSKNQLG